MGFWSKIIMMNKKKINSKEKRKIKGETRK